MPQWFWMYSFSACMKYVTESEEETDMWRGFQGMAAGYGWCRGLVSWSVCAAVFSKAVTSDGWFGGGLCKAARRPSGVLYVNELITLLIGHVRCVTLPHSQPFFFSFFFSRCLSLSSLWRIIAASFPLCISLSIRGLSKVEFRPQQKRPKLIHSFDSLIHRYEIRD